ncbi:cytochrome c [Alphaproteobacteria bacterium]|jgi:S-disulfanyl-L-cysteine oxidoreductase SoxD|nr:cytochrome c [Alphaproteobacteria bacterium]
MSNWFKSGFLAATLLTTASLSFAGEPRIGLGTVPTAEEIARWDIDVRPDGYGLPPGSGNAYDGEEIFIEKCASCHGEFGEGAGRWPVLVGGQDTLDSEDPVKTIGSYWPYTSTMYDYIYRAMPFGDAQSLTPDETYAIIAYLLYSNDIIEEDDFEITADNLAKIEMPNKDGFIPDDREVVSGERCMKDCKISVEIASRARVLDVTPDQ